MTTSASLGSRRGVMVAQAAVVEEEGEVAGAAMLEKDEGAREEADEAVEETEEEIASESKATLLKTNVTFPTNVPS